MSDRTLFWVVGVGGAVLVMALVAAALLWGNSDAECSTNTGMAIGARGSVMPITTTTCE